MKGVPLRIELGPREMEAKSLTVYRRDTGKKVNVKEAVLESFIARAEKDILKTLKSRADRNFAGAIKDAKSMAEAAKALNSGGIARCNFCSIENEGEKCAETVEKELGARVRGTRVDRKETPTGNCISCGKKAGAVVYIAREY